MLFFKIVRYWSQWIIIANVLDEIYLSFEKIQKTEVQIVQVQTYHI